jgi:multidrug resistance efflux pump
VASPFEKTLHGVERDGEAAGSIIALALLLLVAAGWVTWAMRARVTLYAASSRGRMETTSYAHAVGPSVAGVVTDSHLTLGMSVHAGDVLVTLESTPQALALARERARRDAMGNRVTALERVIAAEKNTATLESLAVGAATARAAARGAAAHHLAEKAAARNAIVQHLREADVASGLDAFDSTEKLLQRRDDALALRLEAGEVAADKATHLADRDVTLASLEQTHADLLGAIAESNVAVRTLEFEIAQRSVRAPTSGTVADVAAVTPGLAVAAGQKLATVVPPGAYRLVADYAASDAVGRINTGQGAVIRFDGFPWTQYGSLTAVVVRVGSEARDGVIRVELEPTGEFSVPLSHGMTASVEVAVGHASPMNLLLRNAGELIVPTTVATSAPAVADARAGQ